MSKAKPKPKTTPPAIARDLVVLAADKDTEQALAGLLETRTQSLQMRAIKFDTVIHPQHDPGCLLQSGGILAGYLRSHARAVVVFDREGCGRDELTREALEKMVETVLAQAWADRVAVVVNDPELESWVWSNATHLPDLLGWPNDTQTLPDWLVEQGYLDVVGQVKPARPKEAMAAVLRQVRKPRSAAIFRQIAEKVSFRNCIDPAFHKLLTTLRKWFPVVT